MSSRTHAWRIYSHGTPEAMRWESFQLQNPFAGQVVVRHTAVGVSSFDLEQRRGVRAIALPTILGIQATGVVEAVTPGETRLKRGDRVAYAGEGFGAYADAALVPVSRLVRVPDRIPECIAACLFDWLAACYLLRALRPLHKRDNAVLVDSGSALGFVMCQWLRSLGVKLIWIGAPASAINGTAKAITHASDLSAARQELGKLDSVSAAIDLSGTPQSRACIATLARPGARLSLVEHNGDGDAGTLSITRTGLIEATTTQPLMADLAAEVFSAAARMKPLEQQMYPLNKARQAHIDHEQRGFEAATVLLP